MARYCITCGSLVAEGEEVCAGCGAVMESIMAPAASAPVETLSGLFPMMFRAALLDWRVARVAAADTAGTGRACIALILASSPGWISYLLYNHFDADTSFWSVYLVLFLASVLSSLFGAALVASLSQFIAGKRLAITGVFRSMAYAHSPAVLNVTPFEALNSIVGFWVFAAEVAVVRGLTGTARWRAFGLVAIRWALGIMIHIAILPRLEGLLVSNVPFWRGY